MGGVLAGIKTGYHQGFRLVEFFIIALVRVVALAFDFEMILAKPTVDIVLSGTIPSLPGPSALYVAIVITGFEATTVLFASQVALGFELPFVFILLLIFFKNPKIMGVFTNQNITTYALSGIVAFISLLNIWLLIATILGL